MDSEKQGLDMQYWNDTDIPFVAVWMVTYNHEDFITKAVESVMMQETSFSYILYIGEDCSSDRTREICAMLKEKYPQKIELILNNKNIGPIANALQIYDLCIKSGAKYIALLEGDDYWTDKYKLQKQITFLELNSQYSGCFHHGYIIEEPSNKKYECKHPLTNNHQERTIYHSLEEGKSSWMSSSIIFRTEIIRIQGFLEFLSSNKLNGDHALDIWLTRVQPLYYIKEKMANHRHHKGGVWSGRTDRNIEQAKYILIGKKYLLTLDWWNAYEKDIIKRQIKSLYSKIFYLLLKEKRLSDPLLLKSFSYLIIEKTKKYFLIIQKTSSEYIKTNYSEFYFRRGHQLFIEQQFESNDHLVQLTPEWITSYFHSYIDNNKSISPLILVSQSNGKPNSILILQKRIKKINSFIQKRIIETYSRGPIDFFRFIYNETITEEDIYMGLSNYLKKNKASWDEIDITEIPESKIDIDLFIKCFNKQGYKVEVKRPNGFYYVDTNSDWDSYYNEFIKPNNKDLLKDLRQISRKNIKLSVESINHNIYPKLKEILYLYEKRRNSLGQFNSYNTKERQNFVQSVIELYEKKGWVELSLLKDNDNNIWAFQLDWMFNAIRYHWNHAYNEDFKKYSPGKILLYMLMERAFQRSEEIQCNHMRGLATYKNKLANRKEYLLQIKIINPDSKINKIIKLYYQLSLLIRGK